MEYFKGKREAALETLVRITFGTFQTGGLVVLLTLLWGRRLSDSTGHELAVAGYQMLALIYVVRIWCVATILYTSVDQLEKANLNVKLLILAVSAAATVRRLMRSRRRLSVAVGLAADGRGNCELSGSSGSR